MTDITRAYYPLAMAAKKLNCTVADILHFGATNRLEICAYIDGVKVADDYCSFNVFINDEDKDDIVSEISEGNSIFSDMYEISLFKYNELLGVEGGYFRFKGWYANHLKGFFAVPTEYLVDIELSLMDEPVNISPHELFTPKNYGSHIHLANIEGLNIAESRLVVFHSELLCFNVSSTPKYPGSDIEKPKTVAKKAQIIPALIKLLPDMRNVDLDNTPVSKIISIIEELAAKEGVDLPEIHWQTWQKYLGR